MIVLYFKCYVAWRDHEKTSLGTTSSFETSLNSISDIFSQRYIILITIIISLWTMTQKTSISKYNWNVPTSLLQYILLSFHCVFYHLRNSQNKLFLHGHWLEHLNLDVILWKIRHSGKHQAYYVLINILYYFIIWKNTRFCILRRKSYPTI